MNEAILNLRQAYSSHPLMFGLRTSQHHDGLYVTWRCYLSGEYGPIGKRRLNHVQFVAELLEELRRLRLGVGLRMVA